MQLEFQNELLIFYRYIKNFSYLVNTIKKKKNKYFTVVINKGISK